MKGYHDSTTNPENRDTWQTPKYIFDWFNKEYEFVADVASSSSNTLCDKFISQEQDSLKTDWSSVAGDSEFVWCNPPYSSPRPFIEKATFEAKENHIGCVMLLPADTSVKWFSEILRSAAEVILITDGRISFISSETGKPKGGNNKGSLIAIWEPYFMDDCRISHLSLKDIKSNG